MDQASKARHGIRLAERALVVSLALIGTSAACAADYPVVDGIIQFPNVRVVDAPRSGPVAVAGQGGMRAFKDSAASDLRGPSTEEMQTVSAASSTTPTGARRLAVARSAAGTPVATSDVGGVGVTLDESSLQYSVMVRQPDGSLAEVCVMGIDKANDIATKQPVLKTATRKEILNDR